ncbi:hypothetical protein AVEN_115993-1 [Araneus ventricosus]|uniref:Uncharacterized protein n=1 Tax=Araneus ventricosus TaxID=182803 RepID=A0A4Y2EJA3_ARAVE|nr:hypothetical protein AVEN_115993-1 [Araneus ventricosus]
MATAIVIKLLSRYSKVAIRYAMRLLNCDLTKCGRMEHLPVICTYLIYPSCCRNIHLKRLDCTSRFTRCSIAGDVLAQVSVVRHRRSCSVDGRDFPLPNNEYIACCTRHYTKSMSHPFIPYLQGTLTRYLSDSCKAVIHVTSFNIRCQ